jgi:hypothetical protein
MRVALAGAELEENLGLRYMASSLEAEGHEVEIVPFNNEADIPAAVEHIVRWKPELTGLSMVFTSRAREFCDLAGALRRGGYRGRVIAGGHFASLNCTRLLEDFPAFDWVALGEGEELMCRLAGSPGDVADIPGLCLRGSGGEPSVHPSQGNPEDLDALPFPKRTTFHEYFGKPIASILSSRGCWRNCAFCSINAWYKQGGGKRFRVRSVENIVAEMKQLYFDHGVRIFNFQDDNFFLPHREKAARRFERLRAGLAREGVENIAVAVKARPDSITRESVAVLDDLGLFRVFLGVENASENGLRHLNRRCEFEQILEALTILNDYDTHIAFNLLMFEPDTVLDDILINLRFIERHLDNPFNFCRAEAYAGTGLEEKLVAENRLEGSYFGFDYRLADPRSEAFHQIANYAFFDRNFSDFGLHYFNMQVDFYFQLLRRFHPELLTQTLRGAVRNFIKRTNLDTYEHLCALYDFVAAANPRDHLAVRGFARDLRRRVDTGGERLHAEGEQLIRWLTQTYEQRHRKTAPPAAARDELPLLPFAPVPYSGRASLGQPVPDSLFGVAAGPIPYRPLRRNVFEQTPHVC